jgi:hypothetical protein
VTEGVDVTDSAVPLDEFLTQAAGDVAEIFAKAFSSLYPDHPANRQAA